MVTAAYYVAVYNVADGKLLWYRTKDTTYITDGRVVIVGPIVEVVDGKLLAALVDSGGELAE